MSKYVLSVGLAILLLVMSGCGTDPKVQLAEISRNTIVYDEIVRLNNCGGKGDTEQVATREFATKIEFEAGITGGYKSIVEGSISAKYSEYRNTSKSLRVVAPPGTNMEFVLRWSDNVRAGNVQVNGENGTYEVRIPVSVEQISSRDLGCGVFSSPFSGQLTPIPPAGQTQSIPTTVPKAVGGYIPKSPEEAAALFGGPPSSAWKQCPGEPLGCWTFALLGASYQIKVPENCLRPDGSIDGWKYEGGYPGMPDEIQGTTRIWKSLAGATIRCH